MRYCSEDDVISIMRDVEDSVTAYEWGRGNWNVKLADYPSIEIPEQNGKLVNTREVRDKMIKYGFTAPDMTVTEFVEDELTAVLEASEVSK